jgi:hypothetical protein
MKIKKPEPDIDIWFVYDDEGNVVCRIIPKFKEISLEQGWKIER